MNVTYYGDGKGNWIRREWAEQCDVTIHFDKACQGVKGHSGLHWRYTADGCFEWSNPKKCSGMTPPGHKSYVSPIDKISESYRCNFTDSVVTDPIEIGRLNREEYNDNESIDRPITDPVERDRLKKLILKNIEEGALPELDLEDI